jgi:hypothetical protein
MDTKIKHWRLLIVLAAINITGCASIPELYNTHQRLESLTRPGALSAEIVRNLHYAR